MSARHSCLDVILKKKTIGLAIENYGVDYTYALPVLETVLQKRVESGAAEDENRGMS